MNLASRFNKPEYLYQPRQLVRRLTRALLPQPDTADLTLPWSLTLRIRPDEDQGRALWHFGIYDLVLSEAVWRLVEPGETAVDAGANIGYVTSLLAARLGANGRVLAFEPHPEIFFQLARNIENWQTQPVARVTAFQAALSSQTGTGFLEPPSDIQHNSGTARVVSNGASLLRIKRRCLDEFRTLYGEIGFAKVDVEGHELEVFEGGRETLGSGCLRDIIFENHGCSFDTPLVSLMMGFGYTVFLLTRTLRCPILAAINEQYPVVPYLPPNFLANRNPARAREKFRAAGWQVLR